MQFESTSKKSRSKKQVGKNQIGQCGVAMIEAIISIPILLVFSFALVDLGAWLTQHYVVSRIVYEVSRTGAGTIDLLPANESDVPGCLVEDDLRGSLELACAKFRDLNHCTMHQRARTLLESHQIRTARATLTTCYNAERKFVETRISMPYGVGQVTNRFSYLDWIYSTRIWPNVTATARAPYLYN